MATPKSPRRLAAALEYRPGLGAPLVTAKGEGELAERIISLARRCGVAVKSDPDLIAVLSALEVGQAIPEEIYVLVAEVLAFVYSLNNDWPAA